MGSARRAGAPICSPGELRERSLDSPAGGDSHSEGRGSALQQSGVTAATRDTVQDTKGIMVHSPATESALSTRTNLCHGSGERALSRACSRREMVG